MEEIKVEKQKNIQEVGREQLLKTLEKDIEIALDETWAESKDVFLEKFLAKLHKNRETSRVD